MTLRNSSKFKIRAADEERPESVLTEQIEYQRFEKLNQRVTIITILIPILIGCVIFVGYRNIREMVSQTQDTGAKELTSLAQSLESTISNLSVKQAKLEEALTGRLAEMEKLEKAVHDSIKKIEATVQGGIKKTDTSLAEIQAGKADRKELAADISGMDSKLAGVQREAKAGLEKLSADLKSAEKKFSEDFAKSSEAVNTVATRVAECQADIGLMSAEKADKKTMEISFKNQEKHLLEQTSQLFRNLEVKMEALNAGIMEHEKNKSIQEKNLLPQPPKKP